MMNPEFSPVKYSSGGLSPQLCVELLSVTPPFGLEGGAPGAPARIEMIPPNGNSRRLNSKGGFLVPAGGAGSNNAPRGCWPPS